MAGEKLLCPWAPELRLPVGSPALGDWAPHLIPSFVRAAPRRVLPWFTGCSELEGVNPTSWN